MAPESARFHVVPVPYEKTVSYGNGTAKGPAAIIEASSQLERFDGESDPGAEGIYCFRGRSREVESDERMFVLADVRGRSPDGDRDVTLHLPAFEHAFYEACRCLRANLSHSDPRRRMQWNRIVLFVGPEVVPDAEQTHHPAAKAARLRHWPFAAVAHPSCRVGAVGCERAR